MTDWSKASDVEINAEVARRCGHEPHYAMGKYPQYPEFVTSLDAMAEAEATMDDEERLAQANAVGELEPGEYAEGVVMRARSVLKKWCQDREEEAICLGVFFGLAASARTRALAFLSATENRPHAH